MLSRIIPARAGFTHIRTGHRTHVKDHPRSRGVYQHYSQIRRPRLGSSPLARGLRAEALDYMRRKRIIPARAGFTHP